MKERERLVVSGLVIFLIILWLGFLVHRSPRFAGSLPGGVLAISGTLLMLVPLAYMLVKRVSPIRNSIIQRVSMPTLLRWHIYAGILGPTLVILHTGHKFFSTLGVALTAMVVLVTLSGFTGRYLMGMFSDNIREQNEMLAQLLLAYRSTATEIVAHPEQAALLQPFSRGVPHFLADLFLNTNQENLAPMPASVRILRLTESISDLEYSIKANERIKEWFGRWLKFHIVIAFVLYGLLALHVWSGIYFGLRWFE